jgi:leucyl-tRNA synthetase
VHHRELADLDTLNWPEGVKTAQKNWIGRSEGAEFDFKLADIQDEAGNQMLVKIFTTRADTLFGATFVAISAELASMWFDKGIIKGDEVKNYIATTIEEQKKENDYSAIPEKTGVFSGIYAINPATNEKIPVWIANYVIGGVGTGAIMAVPAHDERDYDFAKKYNLPIKQVVVSCAPDSKNPPQDGFKEVKRNTVIVHLRDKSTGKFALLDWHGTLEGITTAIMGGVEAGQTPEEAVINEIKEEAALSDVRIVKKLSWITAAKYCASHKMENRCAHTYAFLAEIDSILNQGSISDNEQKLHTLVWVDENEVLSCLTPDHQKQVWKLLQREEVLTGGGYLINSGEFEGRDSEEAKIAIIEAFGGKKVVKYKIQDWVFARQRYWGEPFPVVRDENGKVYMVDESELPVILPEVEKYEPTGTGESPLAGIDSWVNVKGFITEKGTFKQSSDGTMFKRETNTMPQWAGSSWYYLRFMDPNNTNVLVDSAVEKAWSPVDVYVGGDHATRHLIYARFWHKFLFDLGVVSTSEPFARLEFLGFILAEDGRKMSKRWGNIINPDDVVAEYGADTLRVYEMFMAPFEQTAAWSTSSIKGSDKFLDRVYALATKVSETSTVTTELHKTIKKVTEDIENFKFNTAVSQMMILVNAMESGSFTKEDYRVFLQVLAPFAPHLTEEAWSLLGNTTSVHTSVWPIYDEKYIMTSQVTLAIQIGGKMRGTIEIARDSSDEDVISVVKAHEMYQKYVGEVEPKKVIIVKNKIVNIVI